MVLHHSPQGWRAPVAFEELFEGPADVLAALAEHVPRFRFVLTDLSKTSDDELRGGALAQVGYLLLKHINDGDLLENYLLARKFVQDKGYRLCLDGLTHKTFDMFDRGWLGADIVRIAVENISTRRIGAGLDNFGFR